VDGRSDDNRGVPPPRRALALAPFAILVVLALAPLGYGEPDRTKSTSDAFVPSFPGPRAVVWAVGDGADGGRAAIALARTIARSDVDRFLYLGDVYPNGTASDFARRYAPVYGSLAPITAPTPGNHDWPNRAEGYNRYWRTVRGKSPPAYYSFTVAGWEVLMLNSEAAHGTNSPQLSWLRSRLRAPGTCRIAAWHRPRFSAGTAHGDQPDVAPLWNALRGHATIVLNGHEHNMQRHAPRSGLTELVSGAGGFSHYRLRRPYPGLVFGNDSTWGAVRLDLRPGLARFRFVTTGGVTLHAGTVRCVV
jgi:hypothetical protein